MSCTRREFVRAGLGTLALSSLPAIGRRAWADSAHAAAPAGDRQTVLVVLQLTGGNDGLNTVVPYADDEYGRNRTTLRLPTAALHKIDSAVAFHPRMEAFLRLYQEGSLGIVHGVGHAIPEQSHDRAMRIWHTADPERPERQTGWLGRAIDRAWRPTDADTKAAFVGAIARPFALNAECVTVPSVRSVQDLVLRFPAGRRVDKAEPAEFSSAQTDNHFLDFVRQHRRHAYAQSRQVEAIAASNTGSDEYPPFRLAGDLRTIAQLIRADLGIRIFFAELGGGGIGGFDNHANQRGNHGALLGQLAESVSAFVQDLKRDRLLDRVLLMTFSEFGRTVKENGRRGTGHGAAAPMFLVGGGVKGGQTGTYPSLTDLDHGGLKFQVDFRRVFATVLDRWLGFDSHPILGDRFELLDVLRT